ncbi:MAG: AAA family ATPase [Chitinophagales bacterium]|nr:AAA family ATPase [Chitinophagales bacterium]
MKLCRIIIADYQQFKLFDLDFRTQDGRIPDKICFIGKNGTGKTTLLKLIASFIQNLKHGVDDDSYFTQNPTDKNRFIFEFEYNDKRYFCAFFLKSFNGKQWKTFPKILLDTSALQELGLSYEDLLFSKNSISLDSLFSWSNGLKNQHNTTQHKFTPYNYNNPNPISRELLIYSPAEFSPSWISDLYTSSNRNEAEKFFREFPFYHEITPDHLKDFWGLVTYQRLKRAADRENYRELPENSNKTVSKVESEFNSKNPDFLKELSDLWTMILDEAGIYFDHESARNPIQLNENLVAHFKLKNSGRVIPYHLMSTGIKHLILRLGYMRALYFHRNVISSIMLIDEPENSLYPNLLYNIIETYTNKKKFPNTQSFFATHSPIVAAQFDREERVILDFDDDKNVVYTKGIVPEGDDPNDILIKDFNIESILGEEGVKNWQRFIELKILLNKTNDVRTRKAYLDEYLKIGSNYNFPVSNEVSK